MFFSTSNFPHGAQPRSSEYDKVSPDQLNLLLNKTKISSDEFIPSEKTYNQSDVKELEDYCTRMNILGVNFGNRDPREVLRMLKGRLEPHKQLNENKKQLLQG